MPSGFYLENDLENDFPPTKRCSCSSGVNYPHYSVWGRSSTHYLDKKYSKRDSEGAGISLRCARHANHGSGFNAAWNRDSAVGGLLSVALPSVLGIWVLLLGEQLCDSRIRGCGPSIKVATAGPARKHGRHADGGCIHWTFVCGGHSPGRRSVTLSFTTSFRTCRHGAHQSPTKATLLLRSPAVERHILKNS